MEALNLQRMEQPKILRPVDPDTLQSQLASGTKKFLFVKLNGTLREAHGTSNLSLIPNSKHPKGAVQNNDKVVKYFDFDRENWRCLSRETKIFEE